MFPYKTSIIFDRQSNQPLYLQLANQLIQLIKSQQLAPNTKLPGSRTIAELLQVHRKTIVSCYEELLLQGWVESIPKKGTFVNSNLPLLHQKPIDSSDKKLDINSSAGFHFYQNTILPKKQSNHQEAIMYLNDGICDARLTPMEDIARTYRRTASRKDIYQHLSYGSTYGNDHLRAVLVDYLNESRGLNINKDNILITRGSQMGIWLSAQFLLKDGDVILVGNTNYESADFTFLNQNAKLKRINVDEDGIMTNEIEEFCKTDTIRAIYITSHHHHPTTVTLSAKRRIHLLNLAKQYGFAIIEDDYDYDFNYNHAPILPLASHDLGGNVIYIGSVCKTVAPVFRIGYLIAPKEIVDEAAKLRGYVDRQGDAILEHTFADFIKSGELDRHIRKVLKIYKERRDLFCKLLTDMLGDFFEFEIPRGGMAIWVKLNTNYTWNMFSKIARKHFIEVGDWKRYDHLQSNHNFIRMGFASYNTAEIYELMNRLIKTKTEIINS